MLNTYEYSGHRVLKLDCREGEGGGDDGGVAGRVDDPDHHGEHHKLPAAAAEKLQESNKYICQFNSKKIVLKNCIPWE